MTCPGGVSCVSLEAFVLFMVPFLTIAGIFTLIKWLKPDKDIVSIT